MSLLVTLTLVAVGLIVVALAVSLITILVILRRTLFTLGTVNVGLWSISRRVGLLDPVLAEVNSDLSQVRGRLRATLQAHQPHKSEELV